MNRTRLLTVLGLVIIGSGFWLMLAKSTQPVAKQRPVPLVSAQEVVFEELSPQIRLYAAAENGGHTDLHSQFPGTIDTVFVHPSSVVRKGDKLVCLDVTKVKLDHQMQQLECKALQAEEKITAEEVAQSNKYVKLSAHSLELSRAKFNRVQNLSKDKSVAAQVFENAKVEWVAAQLAHEQKLEANKKLIMKMTKVQTNLAKCLTAVEKSGEILADHCVEAPLDGKIVDTLVARGAVVNAGQSVAIFTPYQGLELHAMVLSSQLEKLGYGVLRAEILLDGEKSDIDFVGVVDSQGKTSRGFEALFKAKGQKIFPGQTHEIIVTLKAVQQAVLIDPEIVFDDRYVYSLSPGENGQSLLKKHTLNCLGYQIQGNKRQLVCQMTDADGVERLLKTRLPSAMSGLRVKTSV